MHVSRFWLESDLAVRDETFGATSEKRVYHYESKEGDTSCFDARKRSKYVRPSLGCMEMSYLVIEEICDHVVKSTA
jgi:hypothetical protein